MDSKDFEKRLLVQSIEFNRHKLSFALEHLQLRNPLARYAAFLHRANDRRHERRPNPEAHLRGDAIPQVADLISNVALILKTLQSFLAHRPEGGWTAETAQRQHAAGPSVH